MTVCVCLHEYIKDSTELYGKELVQPKKTTLDHDGSDVTVATVKHDRSRRARAIMDHDGSHTSATVMFYMDQERLNCRQKFIT